jgi:hypothetical protein
LGLGGFALPWYPTKGVSVIMSYLMIFSQPGWLRFGTASAKGTGASCAAIMNRLKIGIESASF